MRLSVVLFKWPKSRPPGNIWSGKNQMVRRVFPKHLEKLSEDIEREKKNIFYCMHPAATVEQERALYELMDKEEKEIDIKFKLHKALEESTIKAPIRLNQEYYEGLDIRGTWQNFSKK